MFIFSLFYPARPSVPSVGHTGSEPSGKIVCTHVFFVGWQIDKAEFFLFSINHLGSLMVVEVNAFFRHRRFLTVILKFSWSETCYGNQ